MAFQSIRLPWQRRSPRPEVAPLPPRPPQPSPALPPVTQPLPAQTRYPDVGDRMMTDVSGRAEQTGSPRILVVDDEDAILDFVEMGLRYEGFEVELARDGLEALSHFNARRPDLILLDLNLPGLDGIDVCKKVRQASDVPIIMLTARGDVDERVEGLEAGADDYLPKPFKFKELLARVRAVLRRRTSAAERVLRFGALELNRDTREVFLDGRPIHLTPRELDLLEVFMVHPRQVMTRDVLLDRVWGTDYLGDGNLIEVHVSALRDKLGDSDRRLIRTVRGVGYALSGVS
jgi:DNA-binding response OmpR family regulator